MTTNFSNVREATILLALDSLRDGLGLKTVAKHFGISKSVLQRARRKAGIPVPVRKKNSWNAGCRHGQYGYEHPTAKHATTKRRGSGLAEILIFQNFKSERRALKKFDELNHWGGHPSLHMFRYYKNHDVRKAAGAATARKSFQKHKELKTNYYFASRLRSRIWRVLDGNFKSAPTLILLGCSLDRFRAHLAEQFKPGMSFANYGEWEIDHRLPCDAFDLSDPAQQRQCFNFTNLQPLWRAENRRKSNKLTL